MHSLFKEILLKELKKYRDKKILVAFSGGKDSLSLLDFLNKNKLELNISVGACHINHGLRQSAKRDEDFCKLYCQNNNIIFYAVDISNDLKNDKSGGVESSARKYRYLNLLNILEKEHYDYLFTAHTYSDNIENFFIDLYTGASIYTIGGIMAENNKIIRPMLGITTDMVNAYINHHNLSPVFDETNNDTKYIRNKIRHNIIPLLEDAGSGFEKNLKRLQQESIKLNNYFTIKTRHVIIEADNITRLDKNEFLLLYDLEKEFLLGRVYSLYFRVTKNIINETLLFFRENRSKRLDLPNGYMIEQSIKEIKVFHKSYVEDFEYIKDENTSIINTKDFDIEFYGDYAKKRLTIRNRRQGDRVNNKKLKDIFINHHIELFERDRAVVILENNIIKYVENVYLNSNIKIQRIRH